MSSAIDRIRQFFSPHRSLPVGSSSASASEVFGELMLSTGETVSTQSAMRLAVVFACTKIIAETVASLPLHLIRRTKDRQVRAGGHPTYRALRYQPNTYQDSFQFWEAMVAAMLHKGNAYAEKLHDDLGYVVGMNFIIPDRVAPALDDKGVPVYTIDGKQYRRDRIFHITGLSLDGFIGLSPIRYNAEAIGLGQAATKFSGGFYKNGARPAGILTTDQAIQDKDRERLKVAWDGMHGGTGNAYRTAVLGNNLKYQPIAINPEDAQLIQTLKWSIADIARVYRIPLRMLNELDKATFSNIEHQGMEFVTHTIRPWLVRIERAIHSQIIVPEDQLSLYPEFNADALLRGDIGTRYKAYATGIQWGFVSVNDARRKEGMDPVEGGDKYLRPLNMTPIDSQEGEGETNV